MWSLPFLALLIAVSKGWGKVRAAITRRRTLGILTVTALLIAGNWLLYVYAVTSGHILAASFGYYLNPLANVLLGRFVLQGALEPAAMGGGRDCRRGNLGACRRSARPAVDQPHFVHQLRALRITAEDRAGGRDHRPRRRNRACCSRSPSLWLGWQAGAGQPVMGHGDRQAILLVLAGIVSTTPLLLFTAAAKRLPYSTLGMLQFIAPTLQFLIAVLLYGEPFTTAHAIAFPAIWLRSRSMSWRCCDPAAAAGARMMLGGPMFNLVSLIIGFVALIFAAIAFLPLLGWANWLIIPLAIIGAVVGMVSRGTAGRNLNLLVILIGIVRLMLGGGIF